MTDITRRQTLGLGAAAFLTGVLAGRVPVQAAETDTLKEIVADARKFMDENKPVAEASAHGWNGTWPSGGSVTRLGARVSRGSSERREGLGSPGTPPWCLYSLGPSSVW